MMTTSPGRRLTEPRRPGLVLVVDPERGGAPIADLGVLSDLKERIRSVLMTRIDPTVAGRIPRTALRGEVAKLVSEIATEDRVQLNKTRGVGARRRTERRHGQTGAPSNPSWTMTRSPIFWRMARSTSMSNGTESWKGPGHAFVTGNTSSISRSASPRPSGVDRLGKPDG